MQKKFSLPLRIDELKQNQYKYIIEADSDELKDIAEILHIEGATKVKAQIQLKFNKKENILRLWGNVAADLQLQSVISLRIFTQHIEVPFELFFDTKATYRDIKEMDTGINDEVPDIVVNGTINLADIVLEQIALNLDDYPRAAGEEFNFADYTKDAADTVVVEENPFAVLAKLKK